MMKVSLLLGCGVSLSILAAAAPARAQNPPPAQWRQDTALNGITGGGGCAVAIAVGPQNIPFVLGCGTNSAGDHPIYYLNSYLANGVVEYAWTEVHHGSYASHLAVDTAGGVWVSNSAGNLYTALLNASGSLPWPAASDPNGFQSYELLGNNMSSDPSAFYNITNNNGGIFPLNNGIGGCLGNLAIITQPTGPGVNIPPPWDIWDIGCGSPQNTIWEYNVTATNPQWFAPQWGQASGGSLAYFTEQTGPNSYNYVIWSMAGETTTYLWQYSRETNTFTEMPNIPGTAPGAISITDHFANGGGGTYRWNDGSSSWSLFASQFSNNDPSHGTLGNTIAQVAYSSPSKYGGGSQLWGIDISRHIFYAVVPPPPPR